MKISELIAQLTVIHEQQGDLEVRVDPPGSPVFAVYDREDYAEIHH